MSAGTCSTFKNQCIFEEKDRRGRPHLASENENQEVAGRFVSFRRWSQGPSHTKVWQQRENCTALLLNEPVNGNSGDLPRGSEGVCGRFVSYFLKESIIVFLPLMQLKTSHETTNDTWTLLEGRTQRYCWLAEENREWDVYTTGPAIRFLYLRH